MRGWLKPVLLALFVFGCAWGGAIFYWQWHNKVPGSTVLLLYLLVLPLAILLLIWMARALLGLMLAAPAAAAADAAEPSTPAEPAPAAPAPALHILAGALRAPHGGSAAELAEAHAGQLARPDLDPELQDHDGFPVMSARIEDAADPALQDIMTMWMDRNGWPQLRFSEEQWRALALGSAVATELGEAAATHAQLGDAAAVLPMLQLLPLFPPDWSAKQRLAAGSWLRQVVVKAGWPNARVLLAADAGADAAPASTVHILGQLARHVAREEAPLLAIILTCASHIGSATVNRWADGGTLFSAREAQGQIPGEGAAGLLLADATQAALFGSDPYPLLQCAEARRENSADVARRTDASVLRTLVAQVLADSEAEADQVALVLSDTGHRSNRVMELMDVAGGALPQLDLAEDVLQLGVGGGSCEAVPFMTALVLAGQQATEREAPVLCVSNEDPFRRSAALIRPAAVLS